MSKAHLLETYIDSIGLRHFKGRELTPYWSRSNKGGSNTVPPIELWPNIVETLIVLDEARQRLGRSITISSSYRSPAYNKGCGGAKFSQHLVFNALDVQCKDIPPSKVAATIKELRGKQFWNPVSKKPFVFKGGVGKYPTFVHLDCRGHNADW